MCDMFWPLEERLRPFNKNIPKDLLFIPLTKSLPDSISGVKLFLVVQGKVKSPKYPVAFALVSR